MEGEQEEEQEQETGEELAMAAMDISSSPSSINNSPTRKVPISVEVCLKPTSTARHHDVLFAVERLLEKRSLTYKDGPVSVSESDDPFLFENIESIYICDTDNNAYTYLDELTENTILLFWQVTLEVHVFQLNEEGPGEEIEGSDEIASFQEWVLPAREFHGLWDSLMYGKGLKQQLLRYADTALLFAEKGVAPHLISWNRVILFHGPPGTGKTSLCKALAQKLSIRLCKRYSQAQLVEVNAHSLFSKWFSESGKLVTRLFSKIQEFVDEEGSFTFVLIDEVESLAAARQAALSGSEPSDSIRVVNALLTQLDRLKSCPNVMILATSNITGAIDIAFIDRADLKLYIGPPTIEVRYEILHSCLSELCRVGILRKTLEYKFPSYAELQRWASTSNDANQLPHHISNSLLMAAKASEGLSGRVLRKLPFLAYTLLPNKGCVDLSTFLEMVLEAIKGEQAERLRMNGESK